ncbi:MAG TPA: helix-turn-helix domain-containing protein [Acidimicrobiales bacterium]|nr:helix-turn-helix domain-containing protein [Acidimicrobiales bacterium]
MAGLAFAWHHEYYEELENAGADRSIEAWRDLELHVLPYFAGLLESDLDTGRSMVKDWLRTMSGREALTPGSTFRPGRTRYARQTASSYLWLLRQVLAHARDLGYAIPHYAEGNGIHALHPLGRTKKRRAPIVSVEVTAAMAGQLHVIHQSVLWLLRLCGLRISESYGLLVANVVIDTDGDGFLVGGNQGGRRFRHRTDDGEVAEGTHKESGKTDSATRLVALPAPLTALLLTLIDAYHRAPDGSLDPTVRLIPTIRAEGGGQGGFRSALRVAAEAVGGPEDEDSYRIVPHDLRKNFATDLAWAEDVSGLVARRAMGHRVGSDVFDLVYTLDSRLKEHLVPVARQIERELSAAGVNSLMVPTTRRPVYGSELDESRVAAVDAHLEMAGWQRRDRDGLLDVKEVAALLRRDVRTVRRLLPTSIPAVKVGHEWRCRADDVLSFASRSEGYQFLGDLVEGTSTDYYAVYRTMKRMGLTTKKVDGLRGTLLHDVDAELLVAELARVDRLRARSVTVVQAAAMLTTSTSVIYKWMESGRLTLDAERDTNGARYITRGRCGAQRRVDLPAGDLG